MPCPYLLPVLKTKIEISQTNGFIWVCTQFQIRPSKKIKPSKKINVFLVRIVEKHKKQGIFIFYWETDLNIHIKHDIWRIQRAE